MFRARRPSQLFQKIISKGNKGLDQLESYLKAIASQMMKEGQPQERMKEVWNELESVIDYFIKKKQSYITNELHRAYLVQSLELLGYTLDECRQVNKYFKPIAKTILSFFTDASEKVKLASMGAMYNLLNKYLEQGRQFFIEIFERLTVLIADSSGQIRQSATFLNKALKTMVYDTIFDQTALNLKAFVEILAERLQTGGNLAKEFMLDWLTTIQEVPQFQISNDLPLFFRQVFELLLSPSKSLKTKADECLKKFLHVFREILSVQGTLSVKLTDETARMILEMTLLLVRENLSTDITLHALGWIQVFTKFLILEVSKGSEPFLETIYSFMLKDIILVVISTLSDESERVRKISSRINEALISVFPQLKIEKKSIEKASQLLQGLLSQSKVVLRVEATLKWIKFFFLHYNSEYLLDHVHRIMQLIIEKICDRNATKSLYQLLEGSLFIVSYYDQLIQTFLHYLCEHHRIPIEPIFKQILALKDAEKHFLAICQKIQTQKDVVFRYHLIQSLITVLVTEQALENLRKKMNQKDGMRIFGQLFRKFSDNESAALILAFLARKYYLAKEFIQLLAAQQRLSHYNFRSLIRMTNLVEHSNMNHIRTDLRCSQTAVKAYLSLLMTLPYGKCQELLLQRLPPKLPKLPHENINEEEKSESDEMLKQYMSSLSSKVKVKK